jgi:hypothetical protein
VASEEVGSRKLKVEREERATTIAFNFGRSWISMTGHTLPLANFRAFGLLLTRREPLSAGFMSCPVCHASTIRRSQRRQLQDYLFALIGAHAWRCEKCQTRFHSRPIPFRTLFNAHCANCGNLELQRISADHVPGAAAIFWRILGLPALRCDPCRHKFFSLRPLRHKDSPEAGRAEASSSKY